MQTPVTPDGPTARLGTQPRVRALDAVRGLALCGILVSNIPAISYLIKTDAQYDLLPIPFVLELVAKQRFFPIFAFLFGVSFALVMESATRRSPNPRLVVFRRMFALFPLGLLHMPLHPGEVLSVYSVLGLVLLLPATWLPRWLVLVLGAVALVAKPDGIVANVGILLLGYSAGRFGIAQTLDRRTKQVAVAFGAAVLLAAVALPWQLSEMRMSGFSASSAVAGLAMAAAYATGFVLLLRTPLGRGLSAVFEPLGRMALTNYVSATLIVWAMKPVLHLEETRQWGVMLVLAAGILIVQGVFSSWWLKRFRYGPLEWCWRCATWWQIVPNRSVADASEEATVRLATAHQSGRSAPDSAG